MAGVLTGRRPSWVAVGIRGAITALQADLVWTLSLWPVDKELRIEGDAAVGLSIELHHPAVDSLGIELRIDGAIKRVCEVDPPPVAAHFHHLRAAIELAILRAVLGARMARARYDAAGAHLTGG